MEAAFCIETLEDALARYGKPEIFNTDQGSQFTGQTFTDALAGNVDAAPEPLDEHVVAPSAFAVHADGYRWREDRVAAGPRPKA